MYITGTCQCMYCVCYVPVIYCNVYYVTGILHITCHVYYMPTCSVHDRFTIRTLQGHSSHFTGALYWHYRHTTGAFQTYYRYITGTYQVDFMFTKVQCRHINVHMGILEVCCRYVTGILQVYYRSVTYALYLQVHYRYVACIVQVYYWYITGIVNKTHNRSIRINTEFVSTDVRQGGMVRVSDFFRSQTLNLKVGGLLVHGIISDHLDFHCCI